MNDKHIELVIIIFLNNLFLFYLIIIILFIYFFIFLPMFIFILFFSVGGMCTGMSSYLYQVCHLATLVCLRKSSENCDMHQHVRMHVS